MTARFVLTTVTSLMLAASLVACSSVRKTFNADTTAAVEFHVSDQVNPDADGRPSPLVIRVFELADKRQFELETFLTLYEDAPNRLGKDLLDTVKLKEFIPGEVRTESLKLTPDVHYLGLMAEYVQYDTANALMVIPIEAYNTNDVKVFVERLDLLSQEQKAAKDRR